MYIETILIHVGVYEECNVIILKVIPNLQVSKNGKAAKLNDSADGIKLVIDRVSYKSRTIQCMGKTKITNGELDIRTVEAPKENTSKFFDTLYPIYTYIFFLQKIRVF